MSDKAIKYDGLTTDYGSDMAVSEVRHSLQAMRHQRHSFILGSKIALAGAAGLVGFSATGIFTQTAIGSIAVPVAALIGFYFLAEFYANALSEAINDRQEMLRSLAATRRNLDFLDQLWATNLNDREAEVRDTNSSG